MCYMIFVKFLMKFRCVTFFYTIFISIGRTVPFFNPLRAHDVNTLRPRHNGRHFADDIFKCFFLNENVWIPIKFSLKFVPKVPINIIPALVRIMAWRRPGDKPLSEPMMVCLLTHICVTRPQWVKLGQMTTRKSKELCKEIDQILQL